MTPARLGAFGDRFAIVANRDMSAPVRTVARKSTWPSPQLHRHFLGVERSVTGRAWRDRLDERGNARALAIVQRHGVPELLARILAGREIEADAVGAYLDPTLKSLMPDPDVLTDMAAAAQPHRRCGRARRDRSPSSATTTSTARPRRRCSRASCAAAASIR